MNPTSFIINGTSRGENGVNSPSQVHLFHDEVVAAVAAYGLPIGQKIYKNKNGKLYKLNEVKRTGTTSLYNISMGKYIARGTPVTVSFSFDGVSWSYDSTPKSVVPPTIETPEERRLRLIQEAIEERNRRRKKQFEPPPQGGWSGGDDEPEKPEYALYDRFNGIFPQDDGTWLMLIKNGGEENQSRPASWNTGVKWAHDRRTVIHSLVERITENTGLKLKTARNRVEADKRDGLRILYAGRDNVTFKMEDRVGVENVFITITDPTNWQSAFDEYMNFAAQAEAEAIANFEASLPEAVAA